MHEADRGNPKDVARVELDDAATYVKLPLEGAAVVPTVSARGTFQGAPIEIVKISSGSGVTDYVTHETDFSYSTYGIHIGQDDRLTFLGIDQMVEVLLIDCRDDSATLGREVHVSMRVSPDRMIVIPKGVAHTLDGLDGVVTRDEPVWYSGDTPDWHIDNDLVSFPISSQQHPVVATCDQPLPQEASLLISRMSQLINATTHAAYLSRFNVKFKDGDQYVLIRPDWASKGTGAPDRSALIDENRYALTGPESFTIVPTTDSCTSDFLRLDMDSLDQSWTRHPRSHRKITWLGGAGAFAVEIADEHGRTSIIHATSPTLHVNIPPGSWYRFIGSGTAVLRSEQERILPDLEVETGPDYEAAPEGAVPQSRPAPEGDWAFMPGKVTNLLARKESEMVPH